MCGILGVLGFAEKPLFEKALHRLAHRGPDGAGIWQDTGGKIILGHRRLSIIDITDAGSQPMHYEGYTIIFNGEIYNYLEIRDLLEKKGYMFQTNSDTEVLLASFIEWGEECFYKFNGMWAIAIWIQKENTLFLARDRYGKKPLFYSFQGDRFIFGSEMKALLPFMEEVKPSRHFSWISSHLFTYESTDKCLIEGISRFPSGSFAYINMADVEKQSLRLVRYWKTLDNLREVPQSYEDQVDEFRALFTDACRLRMRSDVPIGTALSGGIDSSAVSCTMQHIANNRRNSTLAQNWQYSFVATFPGSVLDERDYAEEVVRHTGAKGVFLPIDPSGGMERLSDYLYFFEELYLTSPIPMMDIYGEVRKHGVKVTIDGHGADELLSGYDGFLQGLNDSIWDSAYAKHILKCWGYDNPTWLDCLRRMISIHHGKKGLILFLLEHLIKAAGEDILQKKLGYLNSELYTLFHDGILPTLLRNYDRYSMANGVEIRMPFMDHRLVSFCFSLPWKSKIPKSSTYTKAIIRDAVGDWMPEKVRFRRSKIGFNTPVAEWLKGPWKEFILDTVQSKNFTECNLIDSENVRQRIETAIFQHVPSHEADRAWAGIMPYFWEQGFLRRAGSIDNL